MVAQIKQIKQIRKFNLKNHYIKLQNKLAYKEYNMKKRLLSLALATAFISTTSHAEIQLSGFASIVGGITTSSDETLNGFDDSFNFSEGSLFALQASSDLGDNLTATVQVLAKGSKDWEPSFNWAFLSYDVSDDLKILVGKQRAPFFMYSDYLDVSYAYPWITPPDEVYNFPFDTFDGLSAIYSTSFGQVDATFHAVYGGTDNTITLPIGDVNNEIDGLAGLAITLNYDWLTLRTSYVDFDELTVPIDFFKGMSDAWSEAGFQDIADNILVSKDNASFFNASFQMNFDKLGVIGEFIEFDAKTTPFGNTKTKSLTLTYQVTDEVILLATYVDSKAKNTFTTDAADFIPVATPTPVGQEPSQAEQFNELKGSTDGFINSFNEDAKTMTYGLRYDFHASAAFKLEYKSYSDDLNRDNDASLVRVALVTIF